MTTELNKIIAIEKGVKSESEKRKSELYHKAQKEGLYVGMSKHYSPLSEDGEQLPDENQKVQVRVPEVLRELKDTITRLWDVVATKDCGNQSASADLVVNGEVLLTGLPATHLIFLEKQLVDIRTFISKLPTLDPAEDWKYNEQNGTYFTTPVKTRREKKVTKVIQLAPATEQHPAQVQTYQDTEMVGTWTVSKLSGALPPRDQRKLLDRVNGLINAVKIAREQANATFVSDVKVGDTLLSWLLEGFTD